MSEVKTNSLKAWILAMRLYSLPGAAVPVVISMALAWVDIQQKTDFSWLVAILSLLFAFVMQVDANIINDYFDCLRGNDNDEMRKGPKRACAQGWITMPAMRIAIGLCTVLGACTGLPLAFLGGWPMITIGALCIAGAFLYTTHLSYRGLGDVLCLIFFGIVPVCVPYYIVTHNVTLPCLCVGLSAGVVIDAMMLINNYRDIENDILAGKRTICVRLGVSKSRMLFAACAPLALLLNIPLALEGHLWAVILPMLSYGPLHILATRRLYVIGEGKGLNAVLGLSAKSIFVFGIATAIGILIS